MTHELISAEYAYPSNIGRDCHEIRVFWRAVADDSMTRAKRAARSATHREARRQGFRTAHFVSMNLDTYSNPQLAALMRYRFVH